MTAIVERKIDELGRVVLPLAMRTAHGWKEGALLEFSLTEDGVLVRTAEPACCVCGAAGELRPVCGKWICPACVAAIGREDSPDCRKRSRP